MGLTVNDLKPIEQALSDMNKQLGGYQKAILQATKATDAFVQKEEEAAKKAKEVSLAVKALGGDFNKTNNRLEIGGKRVDEFGRRLNKVGDVITSFNKRTSILGLSIKELENQGKSFEIFSRETLKEYRKQGGNILEFIAEGISGTREEITLLGMEGAKFRRILYGFFPPGAFRLINKAATLFQFFGSAVRRSTDSGKEHQKNLKKLREERDKHAKGSVEYLEAEEAISKHMEGGEGKMGPLELLMKGFNKIPKMSNNKLQLNREGLIYSDLALSGKAEAQEKTYDKRVKLERIMNSLNPVMKDTNTVLQKFQKVGLGTDFEKPNRKATRTSLKDTRKMLLETNKITNKTAAQNLQKTISSMKMSRDEMTSLRYSSSLRTERGTFGRKLPANLQAQLDTGLKDPSQLNTFNLLNDTLKKLRSGKVQADPTLLEQAKNIQKLLDSSSSINFMIGEVLPQVKLRFEQGKRISILTKLFLMKHAFKLAKLATFTFALLTRNPRKLGRKLMDGAIKGFNILFKAPFTALKGISRFIILMSGYILYYGIIFSALIIALRKPILKGFMAFKEGFAKVAPLILFALDTVWGGFKKIYNGFKNGDLFTIIEGILEVAFGLLLGLWSVALALWAGLLSFIGEFTVKLFNQAKDYVKSFMDGFGANYETLKKGLVILTLVAAVIFGWPAIVIGIGIAVVVVLIKRGGELFESFSGKVATLIEDAIAKIKGAFTPKLPKFKVSMPMMADGGISKGGATIVGERGPEIVNLPRGARVYSNSDSRKMMGHTFNITVNARDSSKAEMRRMAEDIGRMINSKINRSTSSSTFR
mgnify:CR=1 FL=1